MPQVVHIKKDNSKIKHGANQKNSSKNAVRTIAADRVCLEFQGHDNKVL